LKWPWERLANDELSDLQESPRSRSPQRFGQTTSITCGINQQS